MLGHLLICPFYRTELSFEMAVHDNFRILPLLDVTAFYCRYDMNTVSDSCLY